MIKVQNLAKIFGAKRAVDGISFSVERGEVLGFLGPNGAGKSTTMRMITGFIPPSAGTVIGRRVSISSSTGHSGQAADRLSAGKRAGLHRHDGQWLSEFCRGNPRACAATPKRRAVNRAVEMCFLEAVLASKRRNPLQRLSPSHLFRPIHHS